MALGGGAFTAQNKVLPGAYINFVSAANASAELSDRGVAAMAFDLDWGVAGEIFEVTSGDFQKNSRSIFGYDYTHEKMRGLRELFRNIRTLFAYRLNTDAVPAENVFAKAVYGGARGNDLSVTITDSAGNPGMYEVRLYLGNSLVDNQTVSSAEELSGNAYVEWKRGAELEPTAGYPLSGGTNGMTAGTDTHQSFLEKAEAYAFNTIGVVSDDPVINRLYADFAKRMREDCGVKFQAVVYDTPADYEGVINVATEAAGGVKSALCYWVTGICAGCAVNRSNLNKVYDGEFTPVASYTQSALEAAIRAGKFVLHSVGKEKRVLADINSLVTLTDERGEAFRENQTVRVIDQIANDIAVLFNTRYLGVVPNDNSGRISLWADIVKHHEQLRDLRAIEDFTDSDITVEAGDTKKSVVVRDRITVVNAMAQLYMTCIVA